MFSSFLDALSGLKEQGETFYARFTTKDQLDRVIAACFLIAHADGKCDSAEKQKVRALISTKLPQFGAEDITKSWQKAEALVAMDFDFGKGDLIDTIKKAEGDEIAMIARAMLLIGAADGSFDADEKGLAREIITAMGEKPSEFGL